MIAGQQVDVATHEDEPSRDVVQSQYLPPENRSARREKWAPHNASVSPKMANTRARTAKSEAKKDQGKSSPGCVKRCSKQQPAPLGPLDAGRTTQVHLEREGVPAEHGDGGHRHCRTRRRTSPQNDPDPQMRNDPLLGPATRPTRTGGYATNESGEARSRIIAVPGPSELQREEAGVTPLSTVGAPLASRPGEHG